MASKPGKPCSICANLRVGAINTALVAGQQLVEVARDFSVSVDALYRHRLKHLQPLLETDEPAGLRVMLDGSTDLMGAVAGLQTKLMTILRRAERAKDLRTSLACIREGLKALEMIGRMTGAIAADGTRVTVQIKPAGGQDSVRDRILMKLTALAAPAIEGAVITVKGDPQ